MEISQIQILKVWLIQLKIKKSVKNILLIFISAFKQDVVKKRYDSFEDVWIIVQDLQIL